MARCKLHIAGVCYESIADAEGVATTIFFSGCEHHCIGCHSKQTWDFNYGEEVTEELIDMISEEIKKRPFVKTIVLSGGDPFYSPEQVCEFLDALKLDLSKYKIWAYTGFELEEIQTMPHTRKLLSKCDYIVDGPFILEQRDITLKFRGSKNQHIYQKSEFGTFEILE